MYGPGSPMLGLIIFGPMDEIMRVASAFTTAGLSVGLGARDGDVEIVVGSKPPPGWRGPKRE